MEKREMPTFVKSVEAYVSTVAGSVSLVTVELANGLTYPVGVNDAPRVGDRVSVSVSDYGDELPFITDDEKAEAREVLMRLGRR